MIRSKNPALNEKAFDFAQPALGAEAMTIQGAVNKTALLLVLTVLPAVWTWTRFFATGDPASVALWILGGAIGGFIVALVTVFKKEWSPVTAPMYAVLEGLFLGGISAFFEQRFRGLPSRR